MDDQYSSSRLFCVWTVLEAVLVDNKRNVTRKFKLSMHSIMANLNLGQDVVNKRERK